MHTQTEELVLEHGLELPSLGTDEYSLLDTMDLQQVSDIVTLSVNNGTSLAVALRFMLKLTPSLMGLAMVYRLKEQISTVLTFLAIAARNSSSMPESSE